MKEKYVSLRGLPVLCGLAIVLAGLWSLPGSAAAAGCSNEAFRTGPSAALPDCRAYELVTPPDSNGRLVEAFSTFGFDARSDMFPTELGSSFGDSYAYMTLNGSMSSPEEASGTFDRYQALRSEVGGQRFAA